MAAKKKTTPRKKVTKKKRAPSKKKTTAKKVTKKKSPTKRTARKKKTSTKKVKKKTTTAKKAAPNQVIIGSAIEPVASRSNAEVKGLTHVEYDDACKRLQESSCAISQHRMIVQKVFDEHHDELFSHPDVCGLHIGLKRSEGKVCHPLRYCIRLHVRKKWQEGHPMLEVPIDLKQFSHLGVELDVIERSYRLTAASPPYPGPMLGARPIAANMAPDHWGTMGMVVFTLDGQARYLTNKHVAGPPGTKIRESAQGLTFSGQTGILGEVEASIRNATVDCAIIRPAPQRTFITGILKPDELSGVLPGDYAIRKLTSVDEHQTSVFKIGASTGFQPVLAGVVKNVNTSIEVNGLKMTGQIIVESTDHQRIIDGGDSGSIAIVKGQDSGGPANFVVGLVHAETVGPNGSESGHAMVANHFDEVQSTLRIQLFKG